MIGVGAWGSPNAVTWLRRVVLVGVIVASLGNFVVSAIMRGADIDFPLFYAAGQLWHEGANPYDPEALRARLQATAPTVVQDWEVDYLYPPEMAALHGAISQLPASLSERLLKMVSLALLCALIGGLAKIIAAGRTLDLLDVAVLACFVGTASVRINVSQAQLSLPAFVFGLWAYLAARGRHDVAAGVLLALTTIKPTYTPLFGLYFLLLGRWRLLVVAGVAGLVLTLLPIVLAGRPVVDTLMMWSESTRNVNAPGRITDPSPWILDSSLIVNLEPLAYRVLNQQSTFALIIAQVMGLVALGLTMLGFWLRGRRLCLLDLAAMSAVSLLVVYRRNYDLGLLLPGVVYLYLRARSATDNAVAWRYGALVLVILGVATLPANILLGAVYRHLDWNEYYLVRIVLPFTSWLALGVTAILIGEQWWRIRRPAPDADSIGGYATVSALDAPVRE